LHEIDYFNLNVTSQEGKNDSALVTENGMILLFEKMWYEKK